jgi:hypothetical protein
MLIGETLTLNPPLEGVAGADLDLFVYNCTSGSCVLAGQSADGDSEESVTIANPAAGTWACSATSRCAPTPTFWSAAAMSSFRRLPPSVQLGPFTNSEGPRRNSLARPFVLASVLASVGACPVAHSLKLVLVPLPDGRRGSKIGGRCRSCGLCV